MGNIGKLPPIPEVMRAYEFAAKFHGKQRRIGDGVLEIEHCADVGILLYQAGASIPYIQAGILHDIIEDTPCSQAEVLMAFGDDVAHITWGLTDPLELQQYKGLERKRRQAEWIGKQDIATRAVKIADQDRNVAGLTLALGNWSLQDCLDYAEGARIVVGACRLVNTYLEAHFDYTYDRIIRRLMALHAA